jgi:hypothetical protein
MRERLQQYYAGETEAERLVRERLQRDLPARISTMLARAFAAPPHARVEFAYGHEADSLGAVQSLGSAGARDMIQALAEGTIDYTAAWRRVIEILRRNEIDVHREAPLDKTTRRHSLNTKAVGSSDADWLYQRYYEVSLWDPAARDQTLAGRELRLEVIEVVGRRKVVGAFEYRRRSNARTQHVLDQLLDAIRK